jgi:hypothetical protein
MDINYIGEHLWAGQLGQISIIIAFVSALVAAIGLCFWNARNDAAFSDWKLLARSAFSLHIISVFSIIGTSALHALQRHVRVSLCVAAFQF